MGMSASQARLLTITARLHDVEYQAQSIQNAKIQLATQEDKIQQEYLDALDATTLTYKTNNGYVAANFNNLCGRENITDNTIALRDENGSLIVPEEIYKGYMEFQKDAYTDSAYQFALFMIDGNTGKHARYNNVDDAGANNIQNAEQAAYEKLINNEDNNLEGLKEDILDLFRENDPDFTTEDGSDEYDSFSYLYASEQLKALNPDAYKEYQELIGKFFSALYSATYKDGTTGEFVNGAGLVYENLEQGDFIAEDLDKDELNYYINYYNKIKSCGSCVSIEDKKFQGVIGNDDPASDGDWLQDMVKSGKITIEEAKVTRRGGVITSTTLSSTSPSSDENISYTTTTDIDKRALQKAEAKYETEMKKIDRKDKAYDMTLSKLETQRNALTTEYDSVKKVISDNIDRTFGIFS